MFPFKPALEEIIKWKKSYDSPLQTYLLSYKIDMPDYFSATEMKIVQGVEYFSR